MYGVFTWLMPEMWGGGEVYMVGEGLHIDMGLIFTSFQTYFWYINGSYCFSIANFPEISAE